MPKTVLDRIPRTVIACLVLVLAPGVLVCLLINLGSAAGVVGSGWDTSLTEETPTPFPTTLPTPLPVAARVQAISQGDPNAGWDSQQQYSLWWPSACSPAALTAVLRAWGVSVRLGSVLDKLIANKAITPQQGLLHAGALASVAEDVGLHGKTYWQLTLSQVAELAGQGVPVLVNLVDARRQTPYPGFSVGHWLVVVSVSDQRIEVRDSSAYHIRLLSPALFHTLFTGIAVVVWQGAAPALP